MTREKKRNIQQRAKGEGRGEGLLPLKNRGGNIFYFQHHQEGGILERLVGYRAWRKRIKVTSEIKGGTMPFESIERRKKQLLPVRGGNRKKKRNVRNTKSTIRRKGKNFLLVSI